MPAMRAGDGARLAREGLADDVITTSRALVAIAVRTIASVEAGVTVAQHRVLVLLSAHGDLTVTAVAEAMGVNQSNASRLCGRLEKIGLVSRRQSPADGRAVLVSLTGDGRSVVSSVTVARRQEIDAVLERMSAEDARAVAAAFRAFNEAAHEIPDRDWESAP